MISCDHFYIKHMMPYGTRVCICTRCGYRRYDWPCCQCDGEATHQFEIRYRMPVALCDSCFFKYQVMRAAGREDEFLYSCKMPESRRENYFGGPLLGPWDY